ncbi:MAG: T9SS type A sorting domain-containing protein [Bacteroidales bacterium]|nr:T9SS type A sorting domain-containing protein [Bacteroidales bacterium]
MKTLFAILSIFIYSLALSQNEQSFDKISLENSSLIYNNHKSKLKSGIKINTYFLDSIITGKYDYFENLEYKTKHIYQHNEFGYSNENVSQKWDEDLGWVNENQIIYEFFNDSLVVVANIWDGALSLWNPMWRDVSVYNTNGLVTENREYYHPSEINDWKLQHLTLKSYNDSSLLTEETDLYLYSVSEDFLRLNRKDTYIYDEFNRLENLIVYLYNYEQSIWENLNKTTNFWDENDDLICTESIYWDSTENDWTYPILRTEFVYDNQHRKTSEIEYFIFTEESPWDMTNKNTWTYDEFTNSYSKIEYNVEEDNDIPTNRNDKNYNIDGKFLDGYYYIYENDNWNPLIKDENVYDASNNVECYNYYNWNWGDMNWKRVFYNDRVYQTDIGHESLLYPDYSLYQILYTGMIFSDIKYNLVESVFKLDELVLFYWSDIEEPSHINTITSYFNIFPNPCTDYITISGDFNTELISMLIFDITGKCVISTQVGQGEKIDLSGIAGGIYTYEIQDGENIISGKIVKY